MSMYVLLLFSLLGLLQLYFQADAWPPQPEGHEIIDGPDNSSDIDRWYSRWTQWKNAELELARYDPDNNCTGYNIPNLQWTQNNFVQAQVMMHDRFLYNRSSGQYTVDRYLSDVRTRYGGVDSVLLWPSYPNSGIDYRNQWDFFRDLPGGIPSLKKLIAAFHRNGVRVFLPYNPWDTGTRSEEGLEDVVRMYEADVMTLNNFMKTLNADGFNGDTLYGVPKPFFNCSEPKVICPEGGVPTAYLAHNTVSWGYMWGYSNFPPVSRPKFLEPRHMVYVCARWSLNRIPDIQSAFFNGVGYQSWENVWGIWNQMSNRSSEAVRRVYAIMRKFSKAFTSDTWRPYVPTLVDSVFASKFHMGDITIWNIISVREDDVTNTPIITDTSSEEVEYYDLYHGERISAARNINSSVYLRIELEPHGFGSILRCPKNHTISFLQEFLVEMQSISQTPLKYYDNKPKILKQEMNGFSWSDNGLGGHSHKYMAWNHSNMVKISGSSNWDFNVSGVQIEPVPKWTSNIHDYGVGVQFPWENRPWKNHSRTISVSSFYIDPFPVTNSQYLGFLKESLYRPRDTTNFLRDWEKSDIESPPYRWSYPKDCEHKPVTWISHEDAKAYAKFYHKRLPHDWEWQYAAMGGKNYTIYPWGNNWSSDNVPRVHRDIGKFTVSDVGTRMSGCTSSGACDMAGLVWQMTDMFCDDHTCGLLLRGGSSYKPIPSTLFDPNWYFPQAYRNDEHNKFLMLSESYDRSHMVGFRCIADIMV